MSQEIQSYKKSFNYDKDREKSSILEEIQGINHRARIYGFQSLWTSHLPKTVKELFPNTLAIESPNGTITYLSEIDKYGSSLDWKIPAFFSSMLTTSKDLFQKLNEDELRRIKKWISDSHLDERSIEKILNEFESFTTFGNTEGFTTPARIYLAQHII
jgi:hypothetical protein